MERSSDHHWVWSVVTSSIVVECVPIRFFGLIQTEKHAGMAGFAENVLSWTSYPLPPWLVGGLDHDSDFSIYWE